ncbi:hypothetical protein TCAL_10530 [Tigriopus californicus]|uniref:Signal recognition particle 19 kDa protein n=1 Tax=Tigriopus californicus TaxID=6832 RepID=A0A553PG76_TIGCA|nr:signal recognition particle 19 kDa protein-like [Tigriopus californicus]TRY76687.1 hypothetical protein TCAL_10530 [Tigriopus californicus]
MAAAGPVNPPQPVHAHAQRGPPPLRNFSPDFNHSDPERWVCIYPAYLNACKSRQEGRILAKNQCVENPTFMEIREALASNGWNHIVERKIYPRERSKEFEYFGRIRIQLKNDDGTPMRKDFPDRESVLKYLGQTIPQLKSRLNKPHGTPADTAPVPQSSGGGNKKGKKKK